MTRESGLFYVLSLGREPDFPSFGRADAGPATYHGAQSLSPVRNLGMEVPFFCSEKTASECFEARKNPRV